MAKKLNLSPLVTKYYQDLLGKVIKFVEEHQGEKGYIDTQYIEKNVDRITIYRIDNYMQAIDFDLVGIRVVDGSLEVMTEVHSYGSVRVVFSEDDFKNEENWMDFYDEDILCIQSLFNIAECIEEYV